MLQLKLYFTKLKANKIVKGIHVHVYDTDAHILIKNIFLLHTCKGQKRRKKIMLRK